MMELFPLHYCGNICYYTRLLGAKEPVLELHEHFVKQTFRNRMEILGPNGRQKLVVPTAKTGERRTMADVEISYTENWQKDHWKSLEAAYRRSPYFEFYEDRFRPFFKEETKLLSELNLQLMGTILNIIDVEPKANLTTSYSTEINGNDLRKESFEHLEVGQEYMQVFCDRHPFTSNLSILDAIFNLGPKTRQILLPDERN